MNRYQKQINKEVKHYIKDNNPKNNFRTTRKILKSHDEGNQFTLCNCCEQIACRLTKNKLLYCKNWE